MLLIPVLLTANVMPFLSSLAAKHLGKNCQTKPISIVFKEFPEAKLVIVGGGALLEKLKKLVVDLGLTENVILTGFQPYDTMPQYINLADICVNPFIVTMATRDIIPGKIIQYLSCAKPVLATPLPGMVSLPSGPERGVVYSNIDEFAENTIGLPKDNELAMVIGGNGYRYAKNNHDERKIVYKLERILSRTLDTAYLKIDEKNF